MSSSDAVMQAAVGDPAAVFVSEDSGAERNDTPVRSGRWPDPIREHFTVNSYSEVRHLHCLWAPLHEWPADNAHLFDTLLQGAVLYMPALLQILDIACDSVHQELSGQYVRS